MRGSQYWRAAEEKTCRICGEENTHTFWKSTRWSKNEIRIEDFLKENGERLKIIKNIERGKKGRRRSKWWKETICHWI